MEIRKTSESVRRSFENGERKETLESAEYSVVDAAGNVVGNATVWAGSASVNFSLGGFGSVAEGMTRLEGIFAGMPEGEDAAESAE